MIYWRYFPQDCNLVVAQGVLEAVGISLAGYPTGKTYAEFVDRFGVSDGPT
jgi:myosin heavy subunit